MERDDVLVLLEGIWKYCLNAWIFEDLTDEELKQEFSKLPSFDSDPEVAYGIIEFLKDWRDALEDIQWSIDQVLKYMEKNCKAFLR